MQFTVKAYGQNAQCLFSQELRGTKAFDPFEHPEIYWNVRKTKANPYIKQIVEYQVDGVTNYEVAEFFEDCDMKIRTIFADIHNVIRIYPTRKIYNDYEV